MIVGGPSSVFMKSGCLFKFCGNNFFHHFSATPATALCYGSKLDVGTTLKATIDSDSYFSSTLINVTVPGWTMLSMLKACSKGSWKFWLKTERFELRSLYKTYEKLFSMKKINVSQTHKIKQKEDFSLLNNILLDNSATEFSLFKIISD